MKCIIIYFSQTGNTEKVAKAIQKGVKRVADHCDIVKIKEANPRRLYEYDLIGLGCPVFGFREPGNVRAFINDMRFVGGKHIFPFATHGTVGEYFFPSIVPRLKRRGLVVIGMYDCYANVYMMGRNDRYPTAGHPDKIDLEEAGDFGREMVERSRRISAGEMELIPSYPKYVKYNVNKYIKDRRIREMELGVPEDRAFRKFTLKYQKEKCRYPKCRLCMDNCPMDGIDLTVTPPVIAKPCMRPCGFCAKICPTGAITSETRLAETPTSRAASRDMFEEFYLAPLAKAEAEGRFRRLVLVEDIVHNPPMDPNKPQLIIGKGRQ